MMNNSADMVKLKFYDYQLLRLRQDEGIRIFRSPHAAGEQYAHGFI